MAFAKAGYVVWIKPLGEVGSEASLEGSDLTPGEYRHPALVIRGTRRSQDTVMICLVDCPLLLTKLTTDVQQLTTFGGRQIEERHKHTRYHANYLALAPNPPVPGTDVQLHMKSRSLRKPSYVRISKVSKVKASVLEPYMRDEAADLFQLDDASFRLVVSELSSRALIVTKSTRKRHVYPDPAILYEPTNPEPLQRPAARSIMLVGRQTPVAAAAARTAVEHHPLRNATRDYGTLQSKEQLDASAENQTRLVKEQRLQQSEQQYRQWLENYWQDRHRRENAARSAAATSDAGGAAALFLGGIGFIAAMIVGYQLYRSYR
jgi:hypothetical protein